MTVRSGQHFIGEEERHRLSLAALKEKDPEFYKYLEENDKALLDFGEDDDDEEEDDDETAEASALLDKKSKKGKEKAKSKVIPVTKDLLKEWQKQMLKVGCLGSASLLAHPPACSLALCRADSRSLPSATCSNAP